MSKAKYYDTEENGSLTEVDPSGREKALLATVAHHEVLLSILGHVLEDLINNPERIEEAKEPVLGLVHESRRCRVIDVSKDGNDVSVSVDLNQPFTDLVDGISEHLKERPEGEPLH